MLVGLVIVLTAGSALAAEPGETVEAVAPWLLSGVLAFAVPWGLALVAAGGLDPEAARQATLTTLAALALATIGFFGCGFALAFGGVGLVNPDPGFDNLVWEWSPLDITWGPTWGMVGLRGFGLCNEAATPAAYALFFSQLPLVTTAVLIPLLTLRGRTPAAVSLLAGILVATLSYPLAANWVWGGGWLANLGRNMGWGHGLVDWAGTGVVFLVGATTAAAGLLVFFRRRPPEPETTPCVPLPPVHLPLLAVLGAGLTLIGGAGWALGPLYPGLLSPERVMVNFLLAAASGALCPMVYTWFAAGIPDPLMAARGLVAGVIAALAGLPFLPPWAAGLAGLIAGLSIPLLTYTVDHILRWPDPVNTLTTHLWPAICGLLAVGLFADGTAGSGWNLGTSYPGVTGQGVSGLITAPGWLPDWPGQFQAQLAGAAALFGLAFALALVLFALIRGLQAGQKRLRREETAQNSQMA